MNNDDLNLLELFKKMNPAFNYENICKLDDEKIIKYNSLLENFKITNSSKKISTAEKGKALEQLVFYLIEVSGDIFHIKRNIRTNTNELDLFVELAPAGRILFTNGLLPRNSDNFICECKNYDEKLSVTYTGKFCSLLQTNNIKLGILFSYKGVSGKNWTDSCGLIKKFYLSRERLEDRFCVIDFNIEDFEKIANGSNFLQIIDTKLKALQIDTDYNKWLSKHPLEK